MSARNLSNFAESAMAVNRVIQQHFSMNYSYMDRIEQPPAALRTSKSCRIPEDDDAPLGLSPPTDSELLRRRMQNGVKPPPLPVH